MLITVDSSKKAKGVRGKDGRGNEITLIRVKISLLLKYIDKCLAPTTKEQLLVNAGTPYTCKNATNRHHELILTILALSLPEMANVKIKEKLQNFIL